MEFAQHVILPIKKMRILIGIKREKFKKFFLNIEKNWL